jgi:methyl-accepting chemotaxis protein
MKDMEQAMSPSRNRGEGFSEIIKTITKIAFQTNILALNAAVGSRPLQAKRAQDSPSSPEEVRNLAQRSAQSAKETPARSKAR